MKIGVAQITVDPGDVKGNLEKIISNISQLQGNSDLIIFPELTLSGYGHMDLAYSQEFIEDQKKALIDLCSQVQHCPSVIIVGFIDSIKDQKRPNNKDVLYNSVAVIYKGEIIAIRDKTLLPSYDIFYEERYFSEGSRTGVVEVAGFKLGIGICEDLWDEGYNKKVYPKLIEEGAEILINVSASPYNINKIQERKKKIESIVCLNSVPFVYVNLIGSFDGYDGEVVFDGRSLVYNKSGKLIYQAKSFEEESLIIDLNLDNESKIENLEKPAEIYEAIVLGIKEYFRRNGFKRAYIGLSGGIDSAVVAALAVEALGKENIFGVTMPSHITSSETKNDALNIAENLGILCKIRPIVDLYNQWLAKFKQEYERDPDNLTKQNIQARLRGLLLMQETNEDRSSIVISTGNKTELALGFCTIYGDMCGGFAPISDLDKLTVYELANFINEKRNKLIIPQTTIDREPTAELEKDQTDAKNLPAEYKILSPLVTDIVDNELTKKELYKKYDQKIVEATKKLIKVNEFKRRQASPGIRITGKSFGIGRRFPMVYRGDY